MSVRRFDRGEMRRAKKAENGWLRADGFLTRTGVFEYRRADGSVYYELRHPDEVFKADSLATFATVPITIGHPPEFLDDSNTKEFAVGVTGESVVPDGELVKSRLTIFDKDATTGIEKGDVAELSCGYLCDLVEEPGEWNGTRYDAKQTNIRGNHVALVPVGRAGPKARVRLDAKRADAEQVISTGSRPAPLSGGTVAILKLKGISFKVEDQQLAEAVEAELKERTDSATEALELAKKSKKDAEAAQAKVDSLTEDLKKAEAARKDAADPARMRAEVEKKLRLEKLATELAGVKKADSMKERELREAVILKAYPEAKLEGKSDDYVEARFDSAVEKLDADPDDDDDSTDELAAVRKKLDADELSRAKVGGKDEKKVDAEAARLKFIEERQNAWKKPLASSKDKAS